MFYGDYIPNSNTYRDITYVQRACRRHVENPCWYVRTLAPEVRKRLYNIVHVRRAKRIVTYRMLMLINPSVHDVGHTSAQPLLIQARDEVLPNERKKIQYPMSDIARQAMTTNLDPFVRLLGLVEVHLRLPVAAKHVLILQTDTKIVRASERGRQNRKKKPIAKDEKREGATHKFNNPRAMS